MCRDLPRLRRLAAAGALLLAGVQPSALAAVTAVPRSDPPPALSPLDTVAGLLPRARPEDVGMSGARLGRLGEVLWAEVEGGRLAGAVVAVARRGRLVYLESVGYRDVESGDSLDVADRFRIASQTKALVSTAVLMLQEEGRLLLSDPLYRYLPEFRHTSVAVPREGGGYDVVEARRPITLRDLLTHTAGIGYGWGPAADAWAAAGIQGWYFAHREEPVRETVRRMAALPFDRQPGEAFVYGYSTDILGTVVEVVSGLDLRAFLRTRILDPLGMERTSFYVDPVNRTELVTVYSLREGARLTRAPDGPGMEAQGQYVDGPRRSYSGGAGLVSTAGDYLRFLEVLRRGGSAAGVRLLSPHSVALMTTDHVGDLYPARGEGFGLGFRVVDDAGKRGVPGSAGEFGWGGAYHSTYWVDPAEELVVVYLTQLIPAQGARDFGLVRALVYASLDEESG